MSERRLKNIIKRMLDGEDFYTNQNPRITNAEIQQLWDLGFMIQKESLYGAQTPAIWVVHPINKEFKTQATKYLSCTKGKVEE